MRRKSWTEKKMISGWRTLMHMILDDYKKANAHSKGTSYKEMTTLD